MPGLAPFRDGEHAVISNSCSRHDRLLRYARQSLSIRHRTGRRGGRIRVATQGGETREHPDCWHPDRLLESGSHKPARVVECLRGPENLGDIPMEHFEARCRIPSKGRTPGLRYVLPMALAGTISAGPVAGQPIPSGLTACLSARDIPWCVSIIGPTAFNADCNRLSFAFLGHVAWGPLLCVGPITLEVDSHNVFHNHLPLYVEVVPMSDDDPNNACQDQPGHAVMVLRTNFYEPCGSVTRIDVDITDFVPLGTRYAIRTLQLGRPLLNLWSPFIDCVRVTAHPVDEPMTALRSQTWGHVKRLFR